MVAKAPADGYTILVVSTGFIVNPSMYSKIPYDPVKDFAPVTLVAASPNVISAHPEPSRQDAQGAHRAGQSQSRQIQLRAALHRLHAAPRRRAVQAGIPARPRHRAVQQRRAGDQLDHRRPHAARLHGAAAGHEQHQGGQVARARRAQRQALAGAAGRADQRGSRRARARERYADRHRGARRHAEGDHRALAQRDREDGRAARGQAAAGNARLRAGGQYARRVRRSASRPRCARWGKVVRDANIKAD